MSIDKKVIELKVDNLVSLRRQAREMEIELTKDLEQMDRDAFNGLTWGEFTASIKEDIQVNEQLKIERSSYRIIGHYSDEEIKMTVYGNMYYKDDRFDIFINRLSTDRTSSYSTISLPKKYKNLFDEITSEMVKYQIERPSDKYGKELGLAYY